MNRLYRSETDRIIGGVCGGLGEYLHIDPLLVRILFVLFTMLSGLGLLGLAAYIIIWILVPTRQEQTLTQEQIMRQNVEEIGQKARALGQEARNAWRGNRWAGGNAAEISNKRKIVIGGLLVLVGLLILLDNLGILWWFNVGRLWPLLLIALGAVILLNNLKDKR